MGRSARGDCSHPGGGLASWLASGGQAHWAMKTPEVPRFQAHPPVRAAPAGTLHLQLAEVELPAPQLRRELQSGFACGAGGRCAAAVSAIAARAVISVGQHMDADPGEQLVGPNKLGAGLRGDRRQKLVPWRRSREAVRSCLHNAALGASILPGRCPPAAQM